MEAIRTNGKKKVPVIAVDEEELRTHVSGAVRLRSRFSYVKDVASVKYERDYLKKRYRSRFGYEWVAHLKEPLKNN